ncbi:MAG: asparagine synthase (glutamine-hydrolyzing) [Nitrospiraceae bacterium]|nr:asparagine synthase (glutamine-hydrolyzing) [Nitrospiraceae bacterium]
MCGVAGIFVYGNNGLKVQEAELLKMREAMLLRGPDGAGLWINDQRTVGLAHRRLSIIDLTETGAQPMTNAEGDHHIIFNGEIYNYLKLRADLEKRGHRFRSNSDTEVLLHLYREKGERMVDDLRGMYAFAIWDEKRRRLLIARDPFGIKPLYYSDDGNTFRFASQVKALLKSEHVDKTFEPAGHVGFFIFGYVPEPYTLFKQVRALPAGTTLWIDENGRNSIQKFFDFRQELVNAQEQSKINLLDMEDRFHAALRETVQFHLVADVEVGVFLSAGLDSSCLLGLSSESHSQSIHSFTLGFKEYINTANNEVPFAESVAKHYGARHSTAWVSQDDFLSDVDNLLSAMDQPSRDGVNTYFVSKMAARCGMKVAISGLGGDEFLGGYSTFSQLPRMIRQWHMAANFPWFGRWCCRLLAPFARRFTASRHAGLPEHGWNYPGAYFLAKGVFMPWDLHMVMDRDMAKKGLDELQFLARLEDTIRGLKSEHCIISALETVWYMQNQLLRDSDWASMAHSVEVRVPFVDVELFRAIAPFLVAANPPTKQHMARSLSHELPPELLDRPKTGFTVPIHSWLMAGDSSKRAGERGARAWMKKVYAHAIQN